MQSKKEWALSQRLAEESYTELVARLNAPIESPNPEPQKQVPALIDLNEIRKEVSEREAFAVMNSNIWPLVKGALKTGDIDSIKSDLSSMVAGELISPNSAKKLEKLLNRTIADPTYQAVVKLSPCQLNNYDPLTIEELQ